MHPLGIIGSCPATGTAVPSASIPRPMQTARPKGPVIHFIFQGVGLEDFMKNVN